jgi:cation transport protein ChaC
MSDDHGLGGEPTLVITRGSLRDGSMLASLRAHATADFPIRSDAEIDASLDAALANGPLGNVGREDLWLFAYGSLMWNPAFDFTEQTTGLVRGYHRRFCLTLTRGRGSPERPGLMLALDRGGVCRGMAFRIAAASVRSELLLVWRREMLSGAYLARWVTVQTPGGPVRAVTFVVDQAQPRYAGRLSLDTTVARITTASGEVGSNLDYFERTVAALQGLGFRDAALERIAAAIHAGPVSR